MKWWWPLAALVLIAASAGQVRAQVSTIDRPAISIERLWLEPGPGGFLAATDASILRPGHSSWRILGSLMRRPIVLRDLVTGEEASVPVELRLGYELAYARGVSDRWQLGVAAPIVAAQDGDRLQGIGLSEESLAPLAFGDVRLHAKMRMQEEADAALGYGMAVALTLPTGDQDNFAGERGAVLAWTMVGSYRGQGWRVAANLGVRLRTEEVVLLSPARPHGNELIATVAAEGELPARYDIPLGGLVELTRVLGDNGGPSPSELRGGVLILPAKHTRIKVSVGAGVGPEEVGAPKWRVAVVVEHTP